MIDDKQVLIEFAYPDLKSLFRLFLVVVFYMVGGGILAGFFVLNIQLRSSLSKSGFNLLLYTVTLLFTIRYALKKSKQQGASFNLSFNKIKIWLVPVVIVITLAMFVGVERIADLIPMPDSVQKFFERLITKDVFSLIQLVIAAPILEEVLCRGIVLKGLLKNYSPHKAIIISAIFFGIIHLNPWQAIPAVCGGLLFGWIFYKTKSIIPVIIMHATINGTAALLLFLSPNQQPLYNRLSEPYYIILCMFSVVIFVSGCVLIQRKYSSVSS